MVTPRDFVHGRRLETLYKTLAFTLGGDRRAWFSYAAVLPAT